MGINTITGKLKSVSVHKLLNENNALGQTLAFNPTKAAYYTIDWSSATASYTNTTGRPVGLDKYSLLSQTHPVFFLFEFNEPVAANDVVIHFETPTSTFLTDVDGNGNATRLLTLNGNPLSSVVQFQSFGITQSTMSTASDFEFTRGDLPAANSFAVMSQDGSHVETKNQSVNITFTGNANYNYVGIIFDYNAEAMEYVYSLNIGNSVMDSFEDDIGFVFDWSVTV